MAIELNEGAKTYTAKFLNTEGILKFQDITATGQGDAESQWKAQFPGCKLVNLWRKK